VSGCTSLDGTNCVGLVGSGPDLNGPRFLAFENGADPDLVVTDRSDPGTGTVVRIDPATGNRSLVSGSGTGSGPAFDTPFGIDVAANGDIIVADSFGIVRVDPVTGDRTTISGSGTGTGPDFVRPGELEIEPSGNIVVVDALRSLLRVDPASGDRTVISGCTNAGCSSVTGSGPQFTDEVFGLDLLANGDFLVGDGELQALLLVDGSGDRSILSGCANAACSSLVGSGTALTDPLGVVVRKPVPEPGTLLGLLAGGGLLLAMRRQPRL